ncbi:MAG TPA: PucR family transcriptional regulator ligand-binding domain-containing protein, partial [Nocardioides sp.]|uniref:PucR family transcriptional regulator ligand-binding domain-containing protein n=1 Tax=Nocardioides sp. TaxID=35761 RepID=UPI002D008FC8
MDTPSTPTGEGTVGLRWLLARPELGLRPLHLTDGDPALSWAHAIELEDPSPWLRGAGLVLTTGLRLPRSRAGQAAYVARLVAAGARALGFGTGFRFASVPPGVQEACRDLGLPLVEVPLPTPFLGVVQAVSDRLGEQRRQRLQEALATQQQLTRDALRGGAPAVATSLARALGGGVLVLDPDLGVLARAGSRPPTIAAVAAETRGR